MANVVGLLVWSAALAACGAGFDDPFLGLIRVSGETPFADFCGGDRDAGRPFASVEVEPSLAVDPTNPRHLVGVWQQDRWTSGGANGIGTATSFDGGATWEARYPRLGECSLGNPAYNRATDPWITMAADGTAYLFALVYNPETSVNAMVSSRSNDGGLTWGEPTPLRIDTDTDVFNDKNSITADPVDPGRVYAVWDRLTGLDEPMAPTTTGPTWFARTTDAVWEPARAIYDPGPDSQTIANYIVVLPDGTLIDVFALIEHTSSNPVITAAIIRSTDKGQTWSDPIRIAPMRGRGVADPFNGVVIRSGTDLPQIAVDRASGALYVVWQDFLAATGNDGAMIASSLDGGLSWSPPRQVNGDPAAAFTPNVAVASDGTVGVLYYDLRDVRPADTDAFLVTAWLATSHDGGVIWDDEPLSDPFDLRPALLVSSYFLGDYQALATVGELFVPFFVGANEHSPDKTDVYVRQVK